MASLEIILEKSSHTFTQEEKEAFAEEKNRLYRQFLGQLTPNDLTEDVRNTLRSLQKKGIRMAIGSSSRNTRYILARLGLSEAFDVIVDGNQIRRSKPDPEVFLKAAAALGLPAQDCLVVEDAHAGIEAAVAGHFDCAAVRDAGQDPRATYSLENLYSLIRLV